ncbi:hypothetical protein TrST_g12251 [Triparma strigata]|uniref:C2H2-type domain-containing protein n=1 Tax=Triparma strigata TaxID=1606541 RepID=A0A9W7BHN7_9STRA|nr:hypothetical protein TrST_g12251 [Triparma strigata]
MEICLPLEPPLTKPPTSPPPLVRCRTPDPEVFEDETDHVEPPKRATTAFVDSLLPSTMRSLENVLGLVAVREKAAEIDSIQMPGNLMKKFASFQRTVGDPIQDAPHTVTLAELYKRGKSVKPVFEAAIKKVSKKAGIRTNQKPKVNGSKQKRIDHSGKSFKALTLAPLKNLARCEVKVKNDYDGDARRILDFVRCSIVCQDEFEIVNVYQHVLENFETVRVKNRFSECLFVGTRDCLINVKVKGHICEIQLQFAPLLALKEMQHVTWDCYMGKVPDKSMMKKMEMFCSGWWRNNRTARDLVVEVLDSRNMDRIKALADFSEKELAAEARRRLLELVHDGSGAFSMLETLNNYSVLGNKAFDQGEYLQALAHFGHAKDGFEGHFGIDDEKTLAMAGSIAMCHHALGHFDCAIEMFKYVLTKQENLIGRDDENVLATVNNLAVAHEEKGEYSEARVLREWCLEARRKVLGNEHPLTVKALGSLAQVAQLSKNYTLAREMFEQSLKVREFLFGKSNPQTLATVLNVAICSQKMGCYEDAMSYYERGIEGLKMKFGKNHQVVLRNAKNFRTCLRNMGHEGVCRMGELEEEFPDLDVSWHRCNIVGCSFKAKEREKLNKHILNKHKIDVVAVNVNVNLKVEVEEKEEKEGGQGVALTAATWITCGCPGCDYKTKSEEMLERHRNRRHGSVVLESFEEDAAVMCKVIEVEEEERKDEELVASVSTQRKKSVIEFPTVKEMEGSSWIRCDSCDYKTKTQEGLKKHRDRRHKN